MCPIQTHQYYSWGVDLWAITVQNIGQQPQFFELNKMCTFFRLMYAFICFVDPRKQNPSVGYIEVATRDSYRTDADAYGR